MDYTTLINAVLSMGGLGLLFAILLTVANKFLQVEEDPRIGQVADMLPGANCGSCGYAGCANFADNLVSGNTELSLCPVCNDDAREEISSALGLELQTGERDVAVVLCQGTSEEKKARYFGVETCLGSTYASGGERACNYGCMGYGDCVEVCPFNAVQINHNGIAVIDRLACTGCGKCVEACPRKLIELHPISHHVFVLCKNKEKGKAAKAVCKKACIGCGLCSRAVDDKGFSIKDNLAVIDYEAYTKEVVLPTEKCPTKAIVIIGFKDER